MKLKLFITILFFILFVVSCNNQPTSVTENGKLILTVTFEDNHKQETNRKGYSPASGNKGAYHKVSNLNLRKSVIKITSVNLRILEADSTEIIRQILEKQPDDSFHGLINVPSGNDRIIELEAFTNNDLIARGGTSNVDILPGVTSAVGIQLRFLAGVERNLMVISGQNQAGFANAQLPFSLTMKVTDVDSNGVPNIDVVFMVTIGEAFFSNQLDTVRISTNSFGIVSTNFFSGNALGELQVQVSANDRSGDPLIGSPTTLQATIRAPSPVITDFEPAIGIAGSPIRIRGENFDFPPLTLSFGNVTVPNNSIEIISNNEIEALVPTGASSDPIILTTSGGRTQSPIDFTVARSLPEIQLGGTPIGIAVTPDGSRIYVTDSLNDNLFVILSESNTKEDSLSLANFPNPVAIDIASVPGLGELAFIAGRTNGEIAIVSTENNTFIDSRTIAPNINNILINPNGQTGYVTTDSLMYFFDTLLPIIQEVQAGSVPFGLGFCEVANRLFVSNMNSNDIHVFDTVDSIKIKIIPVGNRPRQLVISPDDRFVYCTNQIDNTVTVINALKLTVEETIEVGDAPDGIAITPDSKFVFVANSKSNNISVIDVSKNRVVSVIPAGIQPRNIVVSPQGNRIYVTNSVSGTLTVVELD